MAQESTNFYATNFELGAIPPLFIPQLSRSRWRIDAEVFQTMTTDCHLKHPAVHQSTALVVPTMIRLLAYTLSLVFYHRQVRSHARGRCDSFHELAKRLAYWFVALPPNTSRPAAVGSRDRIDPLLPVSIRTPLPPYSRRPENQRRRAACQPRWALQRPLQLPLSGPSPATRPKSAPCRQSNPRLTESLGVGGVGLTPCRPRRYSEEVAVACAVVPIV